MNLLEQCLAACKQKPKTILFPDALDICVIRAARYLKDENLAEPVLIGSPVAVREFAAEHHISTRGIRVQKPEHDPQFEHRVRLFFDKEKESGLHRYQAANRLKQPVWYAADLLARGKADLVLAGNLSATDDVLRAAMRMIGTAENKETVSSFCILTDADEKRVFAFTDGVVIPRPNEKQLTDMAVETARHFEALTGQTPRVALLSFSTKGSAEHPLIEPQKAALERIRVRRPDLLVDGEVQFDAAITPRVAAQKMPESPLEGQANVLVFPSLNAADIGYKIAQHLAGYHLFGPFVQGLQKPMGLISAQNTSEEMINTALMASCLV